MFMYDFRKVMPHDKGAFHKYLITCFFIKTPRRTCSMILSNLYARLLLSFFDHVFFFIYLFVPLFFSFMASNALL